jgi:hypothetical protein
MFHLHDNTRTRLCRAAFIALCLVPTCAVLGWCVTVRLPSYRLAHERSIAAELGLPVRLANASTPRPGMMLYEGLELLDPASGQPMAWLPFVEVQSSGTTVTLKLPFPATVNGSRLDAFWKLALELLREHQGFRQLRLDAQNLTVHLPDGDQSFTDLHAQLQNEKSEGQLNCTFRPAVAGHKPAAAAELRITRNRDAKAPKSVCHLLTGGPLPCNLVASVWPVAGNLGKASTFYGRILATGRSDDWESELTGNLGSIDLATLMQDFPDKLTGPGQVQLERVLVKNGRIEAAAGNLEAGPGTVSGSLIHAGQTHLGLTVAADVFAGRESNAAYINYQQLSLGFEIGEKGLALHGTWPRRPGAIMVDERRVLVGEPRVALQSVVNLARTLVPNSELQGPITRETGKLMGVLPVPSISDEQIPHAKLRFGRKQN